MAHARHPVRWGGGFTAPTGSCHRSSHNRPRSIYPFAQTRPLVGPRTYGGVGPESVLVKGTERLFHIPLDATRRHPSEPACQASLVTLTLKSSSRDCGSEFGLPQRSLANHSQSHHQDHNYRITQHCAKALSSTTMENVYCCMPASRACSV